MNVFKILYSIFNFYGFLPPAINFILSFNTATIISALIFYLIKRLLRVGYIRTLLIYKDFTNRIADFKIKDDSLDIRRDWKPKIEPQSILPPRIKVWDKLKPVGFKQNDLVIAIEGVDKCLTIRGVLAGELVDEIPKQMRSIILQGFTKEDVRKWMKKVLAQTLSERRLFKDTQFYIFAIILMMILLFNFMIAQRMGIF